MRLIEGNEAANLVVSVEMVEAALRARFSGKGLDNALGVVSAISTAA